MNLEKTKLKTKPGNSLVVQWLELIAFMAETRELRSWEPYGIAKKNKKTKKNTTHYKVGHINIINSILWMRTQSLREVTSLA